VHHLIATDGVQALVDALLDQFRVGLAGRQAEQAVMIGRPLSSRQS
jgi:hypothetical protein